ncbi:pyridoxal 5'-phosphate synthase glutaminase subunit PdxT [Heliophilum fasciatum]|nr:pyridoxal 5'-phosphate synthase glutaminase subunit PdxT [Heliophilum fasciatum]
MTIGVLAMQGAFAEHEKVLRQLGVETMQVRTREQLAEVDGLIIPGGESTTIGKLLMAFELDELLIARARQGMPVWGTCAGMILMAKRIEGYPEQFRLGLMDMTAVRNAFGRQVDSFEVELPVIGLDDQPFTAVFIRAPYLKDAGAGVQILAEYEGKAVLARQGNCLATAFHPELTADRRLHEYFCGIVNRSKE